MKHSPYSRFSVEKMILRDFLAMDRTTLANERTLLSYVRTSLMIVASGVTLIKLFGDSPGVILTGYLMIPLGMAVFVFGLFRYLKIRSAIYMASDLEIEQHNDSASSSEPDA